MNKLAAAVLTLSMLITLSACGSTDMTEQQSSDEISSSASEPSESEQKDESSERTETTERTDAIRFQTYSQEISDELKPEVTKAELRAKCSGDIRRKVSVMDIYNINVLHSNVVGLVGAPLEIDFDEDIQNVRLTFYCNIDEFRGMPESNLILLHYNEEEQRYDQVDRAVIDTENHTVSTSVDEPGVYLLADAYQWYGCWGFDVSEYAYDASAYDYISDWERECDTGCIMEIADIDWVSENAPCFHVSTPEQLAGAVYYVNAIAEDYGYTEIYLENDIDLAGYDWVPMGWDKNAFSGILDGQGHTISNLTINTPGELRTALIGYGLQSEVCDLNVVNAEITGSSYVGILGGEVYNSTDWHDLNVSGKITAPGGSCGAIIGTEAYMSFPNCSADVTVNGEPFEYFSSRLKIVAETEVVEAFTLNLNDDMTITRDEAEGQYQNLCWRVQLNGSSLLQRGAENELTLDTHRWVGTEPGTYTVCLEAYINGTYIRVSNIIEYRLPQ